MGLEFGTWQYIVSTGAATSSATRIVESGWGEVKALGPSSLTMTAERAPGESEVGTCRGFSVSNTWFTGTNEQTNKNRTSTKV
jgi:hypothetical protein